MCDFEFINLREAFNKDEAVRLCQEHDMTVKEAVINNLEIMISSLNEIKNIISDDKRLTNEDWVKAAVPLSSMMNVLGNHWYLED